MDGPTKAQRYVVPCQVVSLPLSLGLGQLRVFSPYGSWDGRDPFWGSSLLKQRTV